MAQESKHPIIVPSRYFGYRADGLHYSLTAMADFAAEAGFGGVDLSLDRYDRFDEFLVMVLYAFRMRCDRLGLTVPVCHLPFFMPDPDDRAAMSRFAREQTEALETAARLSIPCAVIHPVVRHGSRCTGRQWFDENIAVLTPLRERAEQLGVTLCIENMTGQPYPGCPSETVYGSLPKHLRALADRLDAGICWDFGHAHLTGVNQTEALAAVGSRLRAVHIHDNDGIHDTHRIPGDGSIDWPAAMRALGDTDFARGPGFFLDMELKTSDLPDDRSLRLSHAARTLAAARRLSAML